MKKQRIRRQRTIVKMILVNLIVVATIYMIYYFINNNLKDVEITKITNDGIKNVLLGFEEDNSENDKIKKALQETSYAYYRKGAYIQYDNSRRTYRFLPENINSQSRTFSECSAFVYSVYYYTLGIELPDITNEMVAYAKYLNEVAQSENVNSEAKGILYYYDDFSNMTFNNVAINSTSSAVGRVAFKDKVLEKLEVGDIIIWSTGIEGHALIVYDIVYDDNGKPINALILNSTSNFEKDTTKLYRGLSYSDTANKGYTLGNTVIYEPTGVNEGTIQMTTLTHAIYSAKDKKYFSIIRPLLMDENGKYTGKYYKGTCTGSNDVSNYKVSVSLEEYSLNEIAKSRLKYKGIEVEKTVNVFNNSIVNLGDELIYNIKITNNSKETYYDLNVVEKIPDSVTVMDSNNGIENKNTLTWKVSVEAGTTKTISYKVKVKEDYNNLKRVITSTGMVGDIPSGTINNYVSYSLSTKEKEEIFKAYNNLKNSYNGIELIDKIYENVFGVELELSQFSFSEMLTLKDSYYQENSILLNEDYKYSKYILNNYYNALYKNSSGAYFIKYYENVDWSTKNRDTRADYIYPETLQTGDVLIYSNIDDAINSEDGIYAYIYIDDTFYGMKKGSDGQVSAITYSSTDTSTNGNNNLQTLFGKDYYVILRPALVIDTTKKDSNIAPTILPKAGKGKFVMGGVIVIFVICSVGLYIKLRIYKGIK